MNLVYLLSGTNIGNKLLNLDKAAENIQSNIGNVIVRSSVYETEPWGFSNQPSFYNQALLIETRLSPLNILKEIDKIETLIGRDRVKEKKWQHRIIDIDILFFNEEVINEPGLIIPHPYIQERNFTLVPLEEIAGNYIHPILKKTIHLLRKESKDYLIVKKCSLKANFQ